MIANLDLKKFIGEFKIELTVTDSNAQIPAAKDYSIGFLIISQEKEEEYASSIVLNH